MQKDSFEQQSAKHLAAQAVMAYRAGFPIASVSTSLEDKAGIVCHWKEFRSALADDDRLIRRVFAFIYIGTIIDQESTEPASEALRSLVLADQVSALEARQTAVEWGLTKEVTETDPFAHGGYKLASRLLRNERPLVEGLAQHLIAEQRMDQGQVQSWFEQHAGPLVFDELERSISY